MRAPRIIFLAVVLLAIAGGAVATQLVRHHMSPDLGEAVVVDPLESTPSAPGASPNSTPPAPSQRSSGPDRNSPESPPVESNQDSHGSTSKERAGPVSPRAPVAGDDDDEDDDDEDDDHGDAEDDDDNDD